MGTKKASGTRMECPTCGFKWMRPPGEETKPCPKCFKPLPKGMTSPKPAAASPKKAGSPVAAKPKPKAAAPAPAAAPEPAAAAPEPAAAADAGGAASPAKSPTAAAGGVLDRGVGFKKPTAAEGSQAKVGHKMECPTCGFKWNRPAGEENKPCPKCLKPLPKSAVKGVAKVAANTKKGPSIFDKLTDPKQYTGAHKARFDSDGKGRGIAGRY